MLTFSITGAQIKDFMQHLFTHDTFIEFEVRGVVLHTFVNFEITGNCLWQDLRPYIRFVIKGREKPRAMKIIFARVNPDQLHPNAAALFINIIYNVSSEGEQDKITCTTATSQKEFALDRTLDREWDDWVIEFFKKIGITPELG